MFDRISDSNNSTPKTKFSFLYHHDFLRHRDEEKKKSEEIIFQGIMYFELTNSASLGLGKTQWKEYLFPT